MMAHPTPGPGPARKRRLDDHEVEQVVGRLLQVGVLVAAAVVVVGAVMLLVQRGGVDVAFGTFRGEASGLRTIGGILAGVAAGDAAAVVQLGLVLLVATPVARVALTLGAFVVQRDRLYVAMTSLVLVLLLYALLWGRA